MPEKRYRIKSGETLIGYSDLEHLDTMGIAHGLFEPAPGYAAVQPVFRQFTEALDLPADLKEAQVTRYYEERDRLGLSLEHASGRAVLTETIHIEDFGVEAGEWYVSIIVADWETFEELRALDGQAPR